MRTQVTILTVLALTGGLAIATCGDDDSGGPSELCSNGQDDDQDGLTDCLDPDCAQSPYCAGCDHDGVCDPGETTVSCADDCPPATCGDGTCDPGENALLCADDCQPVCPNGACEPTEDATSCPQDCGAGQCAEVADLLSQNGCGSTQACDLAGGGALGCREAGSTDHYQPCAAGSDCQAGDSCISLDGQNLFCAPFCDPSGGTCPGQGQCYIVIPDVDGIQLCGVVTLDNCDLITYDTCDPGQGCYLADNDGGTTCIAAGAVAAGQPCTYANDCLPGYGCVGSGGTYTCEQLCRETVDCDTGSCQSVGSVMPGHADVGRCAP